MKIVINAGHTLDGAGGGAVYDCFIESEINRMIAEEVVKELQKAGHTVITANVNQAETKNAYLNTVCKMANKSGADLFISIHCNASVNHTGNGVEAYTWKGKQLDQAVKVCSEISKLGFKNRGVLDGSALYVIRNTTMPAVLIETFFIDNKTDRSLFFYNGVKNIAAAIVTALK